MYVFEEKMREMDECDMEEFDTLDNSEKAIALSYKMDGGHTRPNSKGIRLARRFYVIYGNNIVSAQLLEVPLINRSRNGAPSRKECVVNDQMSND